MKNRHIRILRPQYRAYRNPGSLAPREEVRITGPLKKYTTR